MSIKKTICVPLKRPKGFVRNPRLLQNIDRAIARQKQSRLSNAMVRALKCSNLAPKTERSKAAKELLIALIEIDCETGSLDRFLDSLMQLN